MKRREFVTLIGGASPLPTDRVQVRSPCGQSSMVGDVVDGSTRRVRVAKFAMR